jgi:glyoxylase-like metal-dependent hydrolase (beta-lactamase superfamily II)/8-oxo-dGTP pyrophosphatase MutT (NUDIX family)
MIEAVAAILVHEEEVFVIKRQPYLRAFPGYMAFPGGKIDADDHVRPAQHALLDGHPDAHVGALFRELSEELDFDLAAAVSTGDVRDITLFGTAITPAFEKIRFTAFYYKIVLARKPVFILDENEISEGQWGTADCLCELYRHGRALMVVPMHNTLLELAQDISVTGCEPFNITIPDGELACIELIHGLRTIPVPSNTLPPASTTNALLLGDRDQTQVLVDPSPESAEAYARLSKTLSRRRLDAILISHHHPDHHERAFELAREKNVPVLLSAITRERIRADFGEQYIANTQLRIIKEGTEVTRWKGQAIRAYELPGHDDGMLGLAPDNLAWFFVADLVQSLGSIVIPDEGGDLVDYLASLQRVIDLNPKVILPSHGIASGGTEILKQAYAHRVDRENQIRPLYRAGASTAQILDSVYPDLVEGLKGLAEQTIHQHIRKLEAEAKSPQ